LKVWVKLYQKLNKKKSVAKLVHVVSGGIGQTEPIMNNAVYLLPVRNWLRSVGIKLILERIFIGVVQVAKKKGHLLPCPFY
jgi:hypothetical protein